MAKKTKTDDRLLELIRLYEEVCAEINPLEKDKKEYWTEIKDLMGDTEEKVVPGFGLVTYKNDKDKEVVEVDRESFEKENPKLYKKYVKVKVVPGNRRLVLKGMEE